MRQVKYGKINVATRQRNALILIVVFNLKNDLSTKLNLGEHVDGKIFSFDK